MRVAGGGQWSFYGIILPTRDGGLAIGSACALPAINRPAMPLTASTDYRSLHVDVCMKIMHF